MDDLPLFLRFLFGRRLEPLLDSLLKLTDVGVFEGLAELVVGVFGTRGDSHPDILTLRAYDVYLPHVVSKSWKTSGFFRLL